ncbi:hypothetical protein LJC59_00205 [Desulfovibrio sp. OttesenSCG-928-A18]|nr:hypothetical protein [Desulfovibrio sp. OttesenSCG-928-A18]
MTLYVFENAEVDHNNPAPIVAVITGNDNAACEALYAEVYGFNDYMCAYATGNGELYETENTVYLQAP